MPRNDGPETEADAPPRSEGAGFDAAAELADLPYVRLSERRASRPVGRGPWLLLALVLVVHVLLAWVAVLLLRPSLQQRLLGGVTTIALIEPTPTLPLAPPPPLPPPVEVAPPARRTHPVPPAKDAISATLDGSKTPALRLYGPNGQLLLPPQGSAATPAPAYSAAAIQGSHIYSGKSPVPYHPTRFNQAWAPVNESLGAKTVGRAVEKLIDKTTVKKTVKLPGGIKLHCALSPLMLLGGCALPPPQPPPKNDDDIRLSLPPARTLTGKPVPQSASSIAPPPSS